MSRPEDGATPLHLAANFGHSDVIRALLVSISNLNEFSYILQVMVLECWSRSDHSSNSWRV